MSMSSSTSLNTVTEYETNISPSISTTCDPNGASTDVARQDPKYFAAKRANGDTSNEHCTNQYRKQADERRPRTPTSGAPFLSQMLASSSLAASSPVVILSNDTAIFEEKSDESPELHVGPQTLSFDPGRHPPRRKPSLHLAERSYQALNWILCT